MKKIISLTLCICLTAMLGLCFSGCGNTYDYDSIDYTGTYSDDLAGTSLNVFNWGEYISDGSDGSLDVNKAFEKLTGIKVNYTNYESNESMYSKLKGGGVSYDIIIPSDYMIERLIKENMVKKIDFSKIDNYKNISDKYKDLYFDPDNEYSVPYAVGMMGLIYNTTVVKKAPDSWSIMWDNAYKNKILTFNNPRDAFAISQLLLGIDFNTTDASDWEKAADKLKEQKSVLQSYVMDEIYDKMESGEAAIAPYYAGDYLTMKENNPDLAFVYPKEGTNIFVDSVCIPSSCKNYKAALMYINFLCEPAIAHAIAEYVYYATPNTAVLDMEDYTLKGNEILYPDEEHTPKTQYYHDLDTTTRQLYEKLWEEVKLY